jgi:hypothetical protein
MELGGRITVAEARGNFHPAAVLNHEWTQIRIE